MRSCDVDYVGDLYEMEKEENQKLKAQLGVAVTALKHIATWEVRNLEADPKREPSFPGRVVAETFSELKAIESGKNK